ncbi:hypothetical protein BDZ89DRAFT_1158804 [Hymenopellis radicata]|nr:hypothetical protein BDZ89DRAFT_1158804 [Hymenopellis radicata]
MPATRPHSNDFLRACEQQQPLPMDGLPKSLCDMDPNSKLVPPKYWLGWAIDRQDLLKLMKVHYPQDVGFSRTSAVYSLPRLLWEEFAIEPDQQRYLAIGIVAERDGKFQTALSVGCSRIGMLGKEVIAQIQAKFGLEPPQWLIDAREWDWTRRTIIIPLRGGKEGECTIITL